MFIHVFFGVVTRGVVTRQRLSNTTDSEHYFTVDQGFMLDKLSVNLSNFI